MQTNSQRSYAIDCIRFFGVSFALLSHIFLSNSPQNDLGGEASILIKFLTRSATPALLILFGIMCELVYVRRMAKDPTATTERMHKRAIECVLATIFASALWLTHHKDFNKVIDQLIFLEKITNFEIFLLYALLLPIAAKVIPLISSRGYRFAFIITIAIVAWHHYIDNKPQLAEPLTHIGSLVGYGDVWGPSVPHAFVLVLFGMSVGRCLSTDFKDKFALLYVASFIATSATITFIELIAVGQAAYIKGIGDMATYRAKNSFIYIAYGTLAFCLISAISTAYSRVGFSFGKRTITTVGSSTFSYFLYGNAIILATKTILPDTTHILIRAMLVLSVCIFFNIILNKILTRYPFVERLKDSLVTHILHPNLCIRKISRLTSS